MPIHCEIVSQDRKVFEGEADIVLAPGVEGEMGILPDHAPLLSTLRFGILKVRFQGKEEVFAVGGGLIEVRPDKVTVLADSAENVLEIDVERAEHARKRAEALLEQAPPKDTDAYDAIERSLRRSQLRLQAAQRYRRTGSRSPIPGSSQDNP